MFRRFPALFTLLAASVHAQTLLPDGKGKEILDNDCQECHGLDPIISQSLPAAQWRKTVARMVRKGASLKPEDIDTLVDYLTIYFGPETANPKTNINQADASELQRALSISSSEARSIVRYREAGRHLNNWGDLVKMNSALAKKLDPKRDIITFR